MRKNFAHSALFILTIILSAAFINQVSARTTIDDLIFGNINKSVFDVLSTQAAVTIVNYDFNTGTSYATLTPTLASGVTSTVSSSPTTFTTFAGTATTAAAFTQNSTAGNAIAFSDSSGANTKYFQFQLGGASLSTYSSYKLYFQSQRSTTGAQTITIAYSTDGTNFTNFGTTQTVATAFSSTTPLVFDLSGITALNNQSNIYFRLYASGASGTGSLRVDNFQVQADNGASANPTVSLAITPATGDETSQTTFTATVTSSAAVTGDQTVNFALTSGAASTADFTSIPATITILSGATSGTATFSVVDDALVEGTESGTFTISNPSSGISLGSPTTASVSVTDNDVAAQPDLTITQSAPPSAPINGTVTYTLTVTNTGAAISTAFDATFVLPASGYTNATVVSKGCFASSSIVGNTVTFTGCTALATNGTTTLTVTVTPTSTGTLTSGTATVDSGNTITESNEANNTAAGVSTTINPPISVVINEIYGGGSNSGAAYNADYIELYNTGATAADLTGYSLQYEAAAGTSSPSSVFILPSVSIPAGGYFLVQTTTAGATGNALPTPDATGSSPNLSGTDGNVFLVAGTTAIGACSSGIAANVIDRIGYGTGVCFEGTGPAPAPASNGFTIQRIPNGTDTNNNSADFRDAIGTPKAVNSVAGNVAPTITDITDKSTPANTATGNISFTIGDTETAANYLSVTATSSNQTLVPNANITLGGTTASRNINITPATNQTGTTTITVTVSDGITTTSDTFVLTVTAANTAPTITSANNATFTVGQAGTFTVTTTGTPTPTLSFTGTLPAGVTFTDNGNGTATIAGTPAAGTNGSYPITITASNGTAPNATQNFTLTVNAASPTTFTVTRTDDRNNATCAVGDCSLREAVNAANAAASNDTITFAIPAGDAGCTSGVCTITLMLGELTINSASTAGTLTITNSTGASNLLISGNNISRVFYLNSGANLTINGVTITKGNGVGTSNSGDGGGIYNLSGTLTLTNSIVSGNTATTGGGIVNSFGSMLTLTNSTVSNNTANNGGGIYNSTSSTLILTNSTVSGNTATNNVGGIFNTGGGTSNLTNSTVSGNTAAVGGGGIDNFNGTLNLTSVTVTKNSTTSTTCTTCSGGIYNLSGSTANLKNTIIAGNTVANASSSPDFLGAVAAGSSYNLIGNGQGTTGISNGDANNNQVGVDPLLDPTLQLNGGTTPNHALLAGSPAIDKGNSFGLTTDQRGFRRPVDFPASTYPNASGGDGADIGAFEVQASPTAATVSVSGQVLTTAGGGIMNIRLSLTDSYGNVKTATTDSSGNYRFDDVQVGQTYILSATGKHYTFSQSVQVLNINEETNQVNFIGSVQKKLRVF